MTGACRARGFPVLQACNVKQGNLAAGREPRSPAAVHDVAYTWMRIDDDQRAARRNG